jgi:hypothetical protein
MAGSSASGPGGTTSSEVEDVDWTAEELVPDEPPREGEVIDDGGPVALPDSADEADVVEQRTEVVADDDEELVRDLDD